MDETLGQQQGLQARPQVEGFVPATNLVVPPYRFVGDTMIIVGEDTGASA